MEKQASIFECYKKDIDQDDDLELIQLADEATRLSVQELNDIYYNDRKMYLDCIQNAS